MSDIDAAFATIVRNVLEGSERDAGRAPLVPDLKEGTAPPIVSTGDGASSSRMESGSTSSVVELGAQGPAMRGQPNAFAWRPQHQVEMLGYRETIQMLTVEDGETVTIDPNLCANWFLTCAGNVTIELADAEAPPDLDELAPTPSFVELVTIWFERPKDKIVTWPFDWKWDIGVRGGAIGSDNPFAGASQDAQIDAFTVMRVPNRGTFAFVSGRKFG